MVMVRLKMSETLREAVTFIEQGHVRVGPHAVTDPAVSQGWGLVDVFRTVVVWPVYFFDTWSFGVSILCMCVIIIMS